MLVKRRKKLEREAVAALQLHTAHSVALRMTYWSERNYPATVLGSPIGRQ
jgi:hypothetical protein